MWYSPWVTSDLYKKSKRADYRSIFRLLDNTMYGSAAVDWYTSDHKEDLLGCFI